MADQLTLAGRPITDTSARLFLADVGLQEALDEGWVEIEDGQVYVANAHDEYVFGRAIKTGADLERLRQAIQTSLPKDKQPEVSDKRGWWQVWGNTRDIHFENRVNTRVLLGTVHGTKLKKDYLGGAKFDMPLYELPRRDASIITAPGFPEVARIAKAFTRGRKILFPMHPQEAGRRRGKADTLEVACASSERTFHHYDTDLPPFLLKIPLSLKHFMYERPIDAECARSALAMTTYLKRWANATNTANDAFAFLPEAMAIVDKKRDTASIVRLPTPYPPPKNKAETWLMPTYSLWSDDMDRPGTTPMLIDMIENQKAPKKTPLRFTIDRVMTPLIKSAMKVYLDLGAANATHGQNIFLEMDMRTGLPSGRAVHADIESIWPHPAILKAAGRPEYYEKNELEPPIEGLEYKTKKEKDSLDINLPNTFRSYFVCGVLAPILRVFAKKYPKQAQKAIDETYDLLEREVKKRASLVKKFSGENQPFEEMNLFLTGEFAFDAYVRDAWKSDRAMDSWLKQNRHPTRDKVRTE